MPSITNSSPRVFNLPALDCSPEAVASYVKGKILTDEEAKTLEPLAMTALGPPPVQSDDPDEARRAIGSSHPNTVQVTAAQLKVLRKVFGRSFSEQEKAGLRIAP